MNVSELNRRRNFKEGYKMKTITITKNVYNYNELNDEVKTNPGGSG